MSNSGNGEGNGPPPREGLAGHELAYRTATMLRAAVQQDPYRTLGLAVGLGLVVGGGMWRVLFRSLVPIASRVAITALVEPVLDRKLTPAAGA